MITTKKMAQTAKTLQTPLLSNYNSDFWEDYITNYEKYDALFARLYSSFYYFLQDDDESAYDVTANFTADVYNHLLLNDKRYNELYRINVLNAQDNDILTNSMSTEKMDKDTSATKGARTDSTSNAYGAQSNSTSVTIGQQQNSENNVYGAQSNSTSESIGAQSNINSVAYGAHTDGTTSSVGQQTITSTDEVSTYDSELLNDNNKRTDVNGSRSDSTSTSIGAHTDTTTISIGAQSNSTSSNIGTHTDTTSATLGSRSDSTSESVGAHTDTVNFSSGSQSDSGTEDYTLTKEGRTGSTSALLKEHNNFWTSYNFYAMIFGEISKELLCV